MQACWPRATPDRKHTYSRPPQVEGEATNRAIMIADMAACRCMSCIRRAKKRTGDPSRKMQGKRVWGEPLIQRLTTMMIAVTHQDWDHFARVAVCADQYNTRHLQTRCRAGFLGRRD
jgi:dihydropyrimidinase